MTSTSMHQLGEATQADTWKPDRVIFTFTNDSDFDTFNMTWSLFANETSTTNTPDDDSWWWSHHPSGYSWFHIVSASVVITIIILVIIIGNFLVIWSIIHDRTLKTTQNLFIASLAVADFMLGLVIIPFSLANELMGYWIFGVVFCEIYKAMDVLLCTASIMSLCLIALDRYWSITRAVHYARQRTRKRAAIMIFTAWFISAVVSIPPLIGWNKAAPESDWPTCSLSEDIGYVIYSSCGSFYIPAFIMVFVYHKIYQAAKQRARRNVVKTPVATQYDKPGEQKHSTESSVTEHAGRKDEGGPDELDDECNYPCDDTLPGNMTEETACDTAIESAPGVTSEEEANEQRKRQRPADVCKVRQKDETSNLLATDSDSCKVINTRNSARLDGFQPVPNSDTDSIDTYQGQHGPGLCSTGPDASTHAADEHNGSLQQFKIVELRANGTSTVTNMGKHPDKKYSLLDRMRRGLFSTRKRSSRRKKQTQNRSAESGKTDCHSAERQKRKLAKARERRATVVLGLVMAAFILSWLPFFTMYLSAPLCPGCIPEVVFKVFFWIGYCNSAINPIIYTVFNRDFRRAFQKVLFGRRKGRR